MSWLDDLGWSHLQGAFAALLAPLHDTDCGQHSTSEALAAAAGRQYSIGICADFGACLPPALPRLTDEQISSNLLLVLLAGHDTSSTTLTRCLSNMFDHPWVMDKLRAEQQAVQAKHGQQITPAALKEMPFADAVLRCAQKPCACHTITSVHFVQSAPSCIPSRHLYPPARMVCCATVVGRPLLCYCCCKAVRLGA